mmetsp:Transcript_38150/g.114063  ORF Transcript_38150/g.114063 Transcript_38150/m.114063 type:complete len:220 (-) Transcript_38150:94-753(-)
MGEELEHEGGRNLIRDVRHAQVKERPRRLDGVPLDHPQFVLIGGALHALEHLPDHPGIVLDRHHALGLLAEWLGHVTRTRTDFQHDVGRFHGRLGDDAGDDGGILQEMLPEAGVGGDEVPPGGRPGSRRRGGGRLGDGLDSRVGGRRPGGGAAALGPIRLGHVLRRLSGCASAGGRRRLHAAPRCSVGGELRRFRVARRCEDEWGYFAGAGSRTKEAVS